MKWEGQEGMIRYLPSTLPSSCISFNTTNLLRYNKQIFILSIVLKEILFTGDYFDCELRS